MWFLWDYVTKYPRRLSYSSMVHPTYSELSFGHERWTRKWAWKISETKLTFLPGAKHTNYFPLVRHDYGMRKYVTNSVAQEPEGSSPHSQQPATSPYLSQLNPHNSHLANLPEIHSGPIPHLNLGLLSALFPSGFPAKTLYNFLSSPMRATCPPTL
jgi:hypothetical protein